MKYVVWDEGERRIFNANPRESVSFIIICYDAQPPLVSSSPLHPSVTPRTNERHRSFDIKALFIPEKLCTHFDNEFPFASEQSDIHSPTILNPILIM